jgi:starch phosphorylase
MLKDYTNNLYIPQINRTIEISQNAYEKIYSLTNWKIYIEQNWSVLHINPINLNAYENNPICVNQAITPACLAYLGNINPDDISVEVFIGKIAENGILYESESTPMTLIQKNGDMYEYKAEIPMTNGGNYGFTYRIVPKNSLLINKQDMGLIKWVS